MLLFRLFTSRKVDHDQTWHVDDLITHSCRVGTRVLDAQHT